MLDTKRPEQQKITNLLRSLKDQELKIANRLGPGVFDYLFIFTDEIKLRIEFPTVLDELTQKELQDYFETANAFLKEVGMPAYPASGNVTEDFLRIQRDVFFWRYSGALALFSEYELMRIPTKLETKLMRMTKSDPKLVAGFAFRDAFVLKESGELDFEATEKKELSEHNIKAYLSSFSEAHLLSYAMVQMQSQISSYSMIPRLFESQLLEINQLILTEICAFFAKKVYDYINKGYSPKDAQTNVQNFYDKLIEGADYRFPEGMKELADIIENITPVALGEIEELTENTVSELVSEYKELTLYFFRQKKIIPLNYYKLVFKKASSEEDEELPYEYILDLYLISDDGTVNNSPSERYTFDLTNEAKTMIFNFVTNGIENPNFGLIDFLGVT